MSNAKNCFQINSQDNVAVILEDVVENESVYLIGSKNNPITALDAIEYGHKIALSDIPKGSPILKYGICIGNAKTAIRIGEWVHLHNCLSEFDERSANFDPRTGAAADTKYE